ncbi:MAG: type II secretion system protein [Elusimicrobiota bacterium]|nr:type II secretion system protein [Elusimicrobiota bacterium]
MSPGRRGATLVEVLATVLLILALAGMAAYGFIRHLEVSRADAARSLVMLAAHANRMQAMDNLVKSTGTASYLPRPGLDGLLRTADGPCGPPWDGGALARCRYLGATDWDSQAYLYRACRRGEGGGCCASCGADAVACARRKPAGRDCTAETAASPVAREAGKSAETEVSRRGGGVRGGAGRPYCEWRYCVDASDRVTALFGAP